MPVPEMLPEEGYKVPIRASFRGPKAIPMLALAKNNMNPLLVLHEEYLEFRVLGRASKRYTDIEWVTTYSNHRSLRMAFVDDGFVFSAFLPNREEMASLMAFLDRKGVTLTDHARSLLGP